LPKKRLQSAKNCLLTYGKPSRNCRNTYGKPKQNFVNDNVSDARTTSFGYRNLKNKANAIAIPSLGGVDFIWTAS
jgi:hypothetical protein